MKIFLDSGNPEETKKAIELLGYLDGQTTNPSLVSKNPKVQEKIKAGEKIEESQLWEIYRSIVTEISSLIPEGSVSIETYADPATTSDEMLAQTYQLNSWIPNAHIKFPSTKEGISAAQRAVQDGIRVNLTLCFSLEQMAAAYSATNGATIGDVFVSPFIGRLDDIGENGLDLIKNGVRLYADSDKHVEILAASVRNLQHFVKSVELGADIVTAPLSVIEEWVARGKPEKIEEINTDLRQIAFQNLDLSAPFTSFSLDHPLTIKGMENFSKDWNNMIK